MRLTDERLAQIRRVLGSCSLESDSSPTIDTGDYVLHIPSGEKWVVACVVGEHLSWMGWPEGMAKLADCQLIEKATEESRINLLKQLADSMTNDHRSIYARHRIEAHP